MSNSDTGKAMVENKPEFTHAQLHILRTLLELPYIGEYAYTYSCFESNGYSKKELKPAMADLRRRGYVFYARGLMDDGEVVGSGNGLVYGKISEVQAMCDGFTPPTQSESEQDYYQRSDLVAIAYANLGIPVNLERIKALEGYIKGLIAQRERAARIDEVKHTICHNHGGWESCPVLNRRVAKLTKELD